jgi:8-oxo-dGTP pyrophosphatase MutT (NUDIX family)
MVLKSLEPGVHLVQSLRSRLTKGITLGVRALVLGPDGGVLLVRHTYVAGWYLPGGGVEPGETAAESLARELDEEAAIAIEGEAQLIGLFFNIIHRRRDHVALYRVDAFRPLRPFAPNAEILEARFFPLAELPEGTTTSTRRRVAEHLEGQPPSPYW